MLAHRELNSPRFDLRAGCNRAVDPGGEYGVQTLVIDDKSREEVEEYLWQ